MTLPVLFDPAVLVHPIDSSSTVPVSLADDWESRVVGSNERYSNPSSYQMIVNRAKSQATRIYDVTSRILTASARMHYIVISYYHRTERSS